MTLRPIACRLRETIVRRRATIGGVIWTGLGFGIRLVLQAGYFVIAARTLGPPVYGAFVGALAVVAIVGTVVGFGSAHVMLRRVASRKEYHSEYFGRALWLTLVTGSAFVVPVALLARFVTDGAVPLVGAIAICLAELLGARLVDLCGLSFQAKEELRVSAGINTSMFACRFAAAAVLAQLVKAPTITQWAIVYMVATILSATAGLVFVRRGGKLTSPTHASREDIVDGAHFSSLLFTQALYNDVDKVLLSKISSAEATGLYTAAYRIVDVAFTPFRALLTPLYPKLFRAGTSGGVGACRRLALKVLPLFVGFGLFVGGFLVLASPLMPDLLGEAFRPSAYAVLLLASVPMLRSVHQLGGDALTGAGLQGLRTAAQVGVAIFSSVLTALLVLRHSWQGAALATVCSEAILGVVLWTLLTRAGRHRPVVGRRSSPQ